MNAGGGIVSIAPMTGPDGDPTPIVIAGAGVAGLEAPLAGAGVRPVPFHPVARGVLLTGAESRRLSASLVGGHSVRSEFASDGGTVADKLDARYLSPRLDSLRAAGLRA